MGWSDDNYDKTCTQCGRTLEHVAGSLYECLSCGNEVYEDDLPDSDSESTRSRCPNGCGISEFMLDGIYLVCANCSMPFYPDELDKYNVHKIFGVCSMCTSVGIFVPDLTGDKEEYCCSNCGVIDKKDDLITKHITSKIYWGTDEYIGCYNCGEHWKKSEGLPPQCGGCGNPLSKIRNIKRRCDLCSSERDETIHIGSWGSIHHFFCFDCKEDFEVPFRKCQICRTGGCQISKNTSIGYTFQCPACDAEFVHTSPGSTTVATTAYNDSEWSDYFYRDPEWTLKDALKRKFLVIAEI